MKMRYSRLVALLAVAAASLAAAVVAGAAPAAKSVGSITLGIPGIPPVFLGVRPYIAFQKGFYAKYGVNVTIKQFTTGTDALRAVQAGQIDAAWSPTPTVLASMAKGADLVGIEGMDVIDWLVGSIDGNVKTCADLKGQTIGIDTIGGARYAALQAMLSKCKLTISDVKTVNFPGAAAMQSMIAGQLKTSVLHIDELAQIRASGKTVNVDVRLTDVDPYQHYDLLITTHAGVKNHYYDFVHMLAGDIAASKWMNDPKNLDEAAQIATITGDTKDISKSAIQDYLKMNWWPYKTSGLGYSRITRTIGLNTKLGNISPAAGLTWKKVVDPRMWRAANVLVNGKKKATGK